MSLFVTVPKTRTHDERVSIWADAEEETLATIDPAADKIRVKIGRPGETPIFDIVSGTPLAGGSNVTLANPCMVRFHQEDTDDATPGTYEIEVAVVDGSDTGVIKHASRGPFILLETQLGGVA